MIKITDKGWAVLKNDTHISRWVEQRGDIENERDLIENIIAPMVKLEGSTIVDVGAMIGDHTATYSRLAGPSGVVLAFEPNPKAFACLQHNATRFTHNNVHLFNVALGESLTRAAFKPNDNVGASHLEESINPGDHVVEVFTLDSVIDSFPMPPVRLLKIDAEGYEPFVIRGASKLLSSAKPAVYYEVHRNALARNGFTSLQLKGMLRNFGYTHFRIIEQCSETDPQYNVLALADL